MIRNELANGLIYFEFELLKNFPVIQAVFSRSGGVSSAPWESLNIGGTVGDNLDRVNENFQRILNVFNIPEQKTAQVHQIHSNRVVRVSGKDLNRKQKIFADGMASNQAGIAMIMRFADCVPVILYDPEKNAAAIYHAGWKGTVHKIGMEAVRVMVKEFGSQPDKILAGIGPSIGPDHYQIGQDVISQIMNSFPGLHQQLLVSGPDGVKLDLWEANRLALKEAGVNKIEVSGICTACELEDWYSHRAENGNTGRFGALVMIDRENNDRDRHSG